MKRQSLGGADDMLGCVVCQSTVDKAMEQFVKEKFGVTVSFQRRVL